MADDSEYDEVEAVVRMPKGERLADSHKTEGWSRGFTPKSAKKGPEHVEIRLKGENDVGPAPEPEVIYVTEYLDAAPSPELSLSEQVLVRIVERVMDELIAAARPYVVEWWSTQAVPALRARRDDWQQKRHARRQPDGTQPATVTTVVADQGADVKAQPQVLAALDGSKIILTSEQFSELFLTWLDREDAQQALLEALANAHIEDAEAGALGWQEGLNQLSPQQRTDRIKEVVSANPAMLENLGRHLLAAGRLELGETVRPRLAGPG